MTNDKNPKVLDGEIVPSDAPQPGRGVFANLGKAAATRSRRRVVEEENELGKALVRNEGLKADLTAAQRRTAIETDKNKDIEQYTAAARGEIRRELQQQSTEMAELNRREKEAEAAADRAIQGHRADKEEEARRENEAIAGRLKAEADALDAQIAIELKRAKLDQVRNNRTGVLATVQAKIKEYEASEAELLAEQEDLQNPVLDNDPSQPFKLKRVQAELATIQKELAELRQRAEELK
ncbi:hypothetical protein [uncultured Roseobacter sp.]|uniref:hypothetical protein n=1 Tax=uncultured Roseobacter sp. TaxID=114847 RepID=UPI0026356C3B|nr:hypothetical protein [uncultured Roseobacter sp.]